MIKRLFVLLLLFWSASAWATYPADIHYSYGSYPWQPSIAALCAYDASSQSNSSTTYACSNVVEGDRNAAGSPHGSWTLTCTIKSSGASCGSGSASANGSYYCKDGSTLTYPANWGSPGGSPSCSGPPPPPDCTAGQKGSGTWYVGSASADHATSPPPINGGSNGQCEINITNVQECYRGTDGKAYCTYDYSQTGQPKAASDSVPPPDPNPPPPKTREDIPPSPPKTDGTCPGGSVQGGFDSSGIPICIGTGSDPRNPGPPPVRTDSPPVTTNNSDGSSDVVQTTAQANGDGSTTTTTTTTHTAPGGTVTKSVSVVTGTTPAGAPGKSDPNPDDAKFDLCKQNPTLSICRQSSVSGACDAVTCTGDAIQCATLRAAAAMECRDKKDHDDLAASPLGALGAAAGAGNDPMKSSLPSKANGSNVAMPSFDQSGWLGSGVMYPDKTITVQGKTITIEFSKYGQYLLVFRYALMVVALLVSFRIVSGAVIRE
jgi:hypothetical protein